ncbi:MAG: pyridoxamine 5'-phosphate oxidase family protein [Chloroflexi bacterium]|nr:pyridoxamine 5'-phosphate oxidase family protein [Chloroflexota bacterium]
MATWAEFAEAAPEMAALGSELRATFGLAFLATVRKDGSPRLHPVCPFVVRGRLFIATNPKSPKRHDLKRDGRYVLHMLPGENDAEFQVRGRARLVEDAQTKAMVLAEGPEAGVQPDGALLNLTPEELLFEYDVEEALSGHWENVGQPDTRPVRKRWREREP